jgi:hypothetical protein
MRAAVMAAALLFPALPAAVFAQQEVATPSAPTERYSTMATPIGALIADPDARAVLEKFLPGISNSPPIVYNTTLKGIQGYSGGKLTDELLAQMDADLARLTPKPWEAAQGKQLRIPNFDEAKVGPYTLPDPLLLSNGEPVRDAKTWWTKRRPEILSMFETIMFGRAPGRPADERFEVFDKGSPALDGKATRKQVLIHLLKDPSAPQIQLVEYIPAAAKKPVPMLLMIGFTAPSSMFDDPGIRPSLVWDPAKKQKVPASQLPQMGKVDINRFLDAGIGVAAFYYGDLDPDFPGGYPLGIRALYGKVDEAHRAPDAWGAFSAWAWSLSRVQDYLETDPAVDAKRVAIQGASRLGKTVLWAAARDQRFAAVIACCSGKMGSALMRRDFGEGVSKDDNGADHWVARNLKEYAGREDALPMDGHMLLALIAPRALLLQTGKADHAADPKGEFLGAVAAGPVYRLLGKQDLGTTSWPPDGPILNDIGYTMHEGGHGIDAADWDIYLAFLKRHLQPEK